jgi:hypothetical protein
MKRLAEIDHNNKNNNNVDSVVSVAIKEVIVGVTFLFVTATFALLISTNIIINPVFPIQSVRGEESSASLSSGNNIKIAVISQPQVHGVAGQFIKIEGTVTNLSPNEPVKGGIAYISLVDTKEKIPVDLEDWSAEKGLYIPSIAPSQSLPLEWNVRLVKAGSYTVDILFNKDGDFSSPPSASSKVFLDVKPKLNLNPGNVLPVAFGVPAALMAILGVINYTRGRKMGIYK